MVVLMVTGYSLGHVLCSKPNNSQCSFAPDYSYKGWSTDREAPCAYTQLEGIGYFVGTVCRGWSNFVNFWTKIWPAEQPRATSDRPDQQFLTYSRARRNIFSEASFGYWEISPCPVKLYIPHNFSPLQNYNSQRWLCQALHCPSYSMLVTRSIETECYFWFEKKRYLIALMASVQSP